jgi:cytochrome c-type biogenesis protein CcmF
MVVFGNLFLWSGLLSALFAAGALTFGFRDKNRNLLKIGRYSLYLTFGLTTIAVISLLIALLTHDFSLTYVANYSSRDMSPIYLLSSLWAGNAGSLLIWAWLLSLFGFIFFLTNRNPRMQLTSYSSAITMFTTAFFLLLILATANPFARLGFTAIDGYGLNPLLENPGMLIHPITLLAGYSGLTIPFSITIAALLVGKLDREWTRVVRPWALLAWLFLGLGNVIGAWWAYVELGWGGYWAWDPVENASLMPWLVITAFLHSLSIQRHRGSFKTWSISLAVFAFILTIFGTFLTRSSLLASVHAFPETGMGPYFILFMLIVIVFSIWLIYRRRRILASDSEAESVVSREGTFLLNNLLFIGSTLVILFGTLFPFLSRTLAGREVEVGASFFNRVNAPLFMSIILLAGICTVIGWNRASGKKLLRTLLWSLVAAVALSVVLFVVGVRQIGVTFSIFVAAFVIGTIFSEWINAVRARSKNANENTFSSFGNLLSTNRPRYGGFIIHAGIVIFAIAAVVSASYSSHSDVTLKAGESTSVGNYRLVYNGLEQYDTARRSGVKASLNVFRDSRPIGVLSSLKYYDPRYEQSAEERQWVTDIGLRSTPVEDLYVILISWDTESAAFSILVNPMIMWLWIGGGIVIFGGLVAFWPSRIKEEFPQTPPPPPASDKSSTSDDIEAKVQAIRRDRAKSRPGSKP